MSATEGTALQPPAETSWIEAWVELHTRPATFFAESGPGRRLPVWIPLFIVGVAGFIDRVDGRLMLAELGGENRFTSMTWPEYWATALVIGCLIGPFRWVLLGWWLRMRAGFCGHWGLDRALCRRIAGFTECILALPTIAIAGISTVLVSAPVATMNEGPAFFGTLIGCGCWSVYANYRAVTANFELRRVAAIVWFLVLPLGMFALIALAVMGAIFAQT